MISNSGHDENGKYSGGKAGDQTQGEWQIQPWYNRPWTNCFRYQSAVVRDLIATLAEEAAANNLIGYDQNQRTTFWDQLKVSGYRPANIKTACEADCSAGVAAIVKAVGYLLNITDLKNVSKDMYTGNEMMELIKAGFVNLTDEAVLTSDKWLYRGDILLCKGHHTAINLTTGARVAEPSWHWVQAGGNWFYQDQNGANWHGWAKLKESHGSWWHWYWFDDMGVMARGAKEIDGKWYFFMPDGPLEGAECITDKVGALVIWNIE